MDIRSSYESIKALWELNLSELEGLRSFIDKDKVNDQFYRRLIIRSTFSIIEGFLSISKDLIKTTVAIDPDTAAKLSWQDLVILNEKKVVLDSKGGIQELEDFQRFIPSIKYTL